MEPSTFSRIRLWCPRPFGTYSQNKQCCTSVKKAAGCDGRSKENEPSCSENTPPAPPSTTTSTTVVGGTGPGDGQGEEGRVMLDTWYVIKPGNTKEKIAFFVAHQCGGGGSRSNAVKVKGNWSTDGTKPKRRRKSHDPAKGAKGPLARPREPCRLAERLCICTEPVAPPCETDPVSVAELVARVEQRSTVGPRGPVRSPSLPGPEERASDPPAPPPAGPGGDTHRVAEAVAKFELARWEGEGAGGRRNGLAKGEGGGAGPGGGGGECASCSGGGEVRIAFRVASGDARSPAEAQSAAGGGPGCIFMSCNHTVCGGAVEKITCDLYHIVSPSSASAVSDMPLLGGGGGNNNHHHHHGNGGLTLSRSDVEMAPATPHPVEEPRREGPPDGAAASPTSSSDKGGPRDCLNGFHVEVVVTGGVDQCVFFGRDGSQGDKEDTVCVTVSGPAPDSKCPSCEDPPPGQLFFLHPLAQSPEPSEQPADRPAEGQPGPPDPEDKAPRLGPEPADPADGPAPPSLYCLYRHVSHDFLEIRFKIQRLLEPRQYLLLLPDHVTLAILAHLPTRALAALKCTCHHFKGVIEAYGVRATDSRWNRDPLYRDDPCKQCKKRHERGDVSLCRWHPKPYHHDLPYGRSYWMCCRRKDRDTPGCRIGLHDNNWVQPSDTLKREEGR
uniref:F-box only protein 46 n=1 Tax=Pristiophorus japonicus TaxID=55135 RepID=UPI00398F23DF